MKLVARILLRTIVVLSVIAGMLLAPQHLAWGAPQTRVTEMLDLANGKVVPLPWEASHVVVRWDGEVSAEVQVRAASANGVWQDWFTVTADADSEETLESAPHVVDAAVKLEARVVSGVASNVRAAAIDTYNGPRRLNLVTGDGQSAAAVDGGAPQPPIVTRSQWGADESIRRGTPEFAPINRMIVHHTVTANNDPNPAATVRAIYAWHVQGNGWNDIGYNFLVDQSGNVYEGRYARTYGPGEAPTAENTAGLGVIGAHASNNNTGSIGISLLGDFTSVEPSAAQQSALTKLLAWESDRHGINPTAPGAIVGHRDVDSTSCPGQLAWNLLPTWRQQVQSIVVLSAPPGNTPGYWLTGSTGSVLPYGSATSFGSMAGQHLNSPIISMSSTATSRGYWLLAGDGGIFSFGDAAFHGSTGGIKLNKPVVGMAKTPTGDGYWLVASDGGIFSFGDAGFYGSTGSMKPNKPVVGMSATPTGRGYWLVASDGGIFAFGDAAFFGSTGSLKLNSPIVTMSTPPGANGYWLIAADGGVFSFNLPFYGSIPMLGPPAFSGARNSAPTESGEGYYVLGADGSVYTFGDARFWGSGIGGGTAVGIALLPEP